MLNKIIQFSLQNRLFILIASVLLMIGGLYQAYHTEAQATSPSWAIRSQSTRPCTSQAAC